jgi:hypothetical protein
MAKNFGARCMIKPHRLWLIACDLEQTQCRDARFFASGLGDLETQTYVALSGKMIKLHRTHIAKNPA